MTSNQILYASQASDTICIMCDAEGFPITAKTIFSHDHYNIDNDVLYFETKTTEAKILKTYLSTKQFRIKFNVKYFYFTNLIKSVRKITDQVIKRIMPTENDFKTESIDLKSRIPQSFYYVNKLDGFQFKALKMMLFSQSAAPVLIDSPFGTGKTRLLSAASEYLITNAESNQKTCRVLLCCHHQASADIFHAKIFYENTQ